MHAAELLSIQERMQLAKQNRPRERTKRNLGGTSTYFGQTNKVR